MKLEHENLTLLIDQNPFQLIFLRDGAVVLRTRPYHKAVTLSQDKSSLLIETETAHLHLKPTPTGFSLQANGEITLSFMLDGHWFGYGEMLHQRLPLETIMLPISPFETCDNGPAGQSCKLTPAWYSSHGVLIWAHTPISVGINQPPGHFPRYEWSLGADKGPFANRPFVDENNLGDQSLTFKGENLQLSLSFSANARTAYQQLLQMVGHPAQIPPEQLFTKPTWTTWARYKTAVSQESVLQFADEIIQHHFPYGVIEIDDRWQKHYGDIAFDPVRFPQPADMIQQLHKLGFKVTAWIIPFFDPQSTAFAEGAAKGYLVRQPDGEPYLVPWWQGKGGLLDVSNPSALDWFLESLLKLQLQTGLDGFKFDAGEACFFPTDAITHEPIQSNQYTQRYVNFVAKHFSLTEVRSGWLNQPAPVFFRQWDKSSTWGADNGLYSVLSGILALSLTGYPFILPDMVGGNAYENQPDAELMIRWTQLNALLPAMQFSLAPWEYDEACSLLCKKYARLHIEFAPIILETARQTARTGQPIIRPVWWSAPENNTLLTCDDQFLLGEDVLVAPVLEQGAISRDVLLPPGQWRDYWTAQLYQGDQTLKDYPAPLQTLPIFMKE